jgi:hypothetical protein
MSSYSSLVILYSIIYSPLDDSVDLVSIVVNFIVSPRSKHLTEDPFTSPELEVLCWKF